MSAWKRIRAHGREGDLDGLRSTPPRVDRLLDSARAPGMFRELSREDEATLHFHRAHLERVHTTREAITMPPKPSSRAGLKAAIASAGVVALMSTGVAFAASGHAPWSGAAAGGPTAIPSHSHPTDDPSDGTTDDPTDDPTGDPTDDQSETAGDEPTESDDTSATDATDAASPDAHAYPGLCRAYAAGQKAEHGNAWSSPAFTALIAAAGGPDALSAFCASLAPAPGHPTHPVHPTHPAKPTHPAHPGHPAKPTHPTHPGHPAKPTHSAHTHTVPTHPAHP
jgi:hypothetical protein